MKGIAKRLRDHSVPENQTGIIKVGMYNRARARIGLTKPVWDSREDAARESTALFECLFAGMTVLYGKIQGKLTRGVNIFGSPFARADVGAFEKSQLSPEFMASMGKLAAPVKLLTPGLHRQNHLLFEILRRQMGQLEVPREYLAWAFIGRDEFFNGLSAVASAAMMKTGKNEELPPEEQKRRVEPLIKALDAVPVSGEAAEAYVRELSRIAGRNVVPHPPEELDSVTIATGEERLEELVAEFAPAKDAAGTPAQAPRPRATAAGPGDDLMRSRGFICHGRAFFAVDQARVESFGHLDSLRRMPKVLALVQEMAGMARGYNEDYREALTEGAKHFTLGKNRHRRMVSARMGLMAKLLEMSRQIFAPGSPLTVVDKPKCLQAMAGVLESVGEGGDDFDTVRNLLAKNFVQVRKLRMMPDMDLRLVKDEEEAQAEAKPSRGPGGRSARVGVPVRGGGVPEDPGRGFGGLVLPGGGGTLPPGPGAHGGHGGQLAGRGWPRPWTWTGPCRSSGPWSSGPWGAWPRPRPGSRTAGSPTPGSWPTCATRCRPSSSSNATPTTRPTPRRSSPWKAGDSPPSVVDDPVRLLSPARRGTACWPCPPARCRPRRGRSCTCLRPPARRRSGRRAWPPRRWGTGRSPRRRGPPPAR